MASQSQNENLESEVESETNKSYFTDGFEETIEDNLVDFAIVDQRISLQYQISDKCVFQVECEEEEREQDLSEKYVYTHSDNDSQITDIRNGSKGAEIVNQPNEDDTVINDEVKGNDMEDNEINIATNRNVNTDSVEDGGTKNNSKQVIPCLLSFLYTSIHFCIYLTTCKLEVDVQCLLSMMYLRSMFICFS